MCIFCVIHFFRKSDNALSHDSLSMIETKDVSEDIRAAFLIPLGYALLIAFWFLLYAMFDGFEFDDTIWAGVDYDELATGGFVKILANVFAQSVWRCVMLGAVNLIVPLYPLASSALLGGFLFKMQKMNKTKMALIVDGVGLFMNVLVFLVGFQQLFFDDNNGIGVDTFVNSLLLMMLSIPRLRHRGLGDEAQVLLGRPCYNDKEEGDEGEVGENNKEQELGGTSSSNPEATEKMEEVDDPPVTEVV